MSSSRLDDCETFTGLACDYDAAGELPADWVEAGSSVGIVYRDGTGQAYTHEVTGAVLIAPGFILIEAPGLELDATGLLNGSVALPEG